MDSKNLRKALLSCPHPVGSMDAVRWACNREKQLYQFALFALDKLDEAEDSAAFKFGANAVRNMRRDTLRELAQKLEELL